MVATLGLAVAAPATADSMLLGVGAGGSTSGATAVAHLELHTGPLALVARGELLQPRATVLLGLRPRNETRRLAPAVGVRQDRARSELVAAARLHPSRDVVGEHVEVGLTALIAGRDQLFVQHARFAPGWFARGQLRVSWLIVGGELGMTGLAVRDPMGGVRPEAYALATLGLAVAR